MDPQLTQAKLSKVFLAGHVDKAFGPIQALRVYLSSASEGLIYAEHSLFKTSHHLLNSLKDIYLNLRWFYQNREGLKIFLGVNNINAFSGVILKKLGFKGKLIYYAVDYSPRRFANPLINKVFHLADRICIQQADYVWSSTPEIQDIRRQQGLPASQNILVRSGVLARNEYDCLTKPRTSLVINGFLSREPLVRLAIKTLKRLQAQFPEASLQIIVGYLNQANLEGYVQELGLGSKVSFWDKIPHQKIASIYTNCGIGLGLFQVSTDFPALYHDPLEIKEFLAAGLPVVCSQGVALAREIIEQEAGVVINNDEDELYRALVSLLLDEEKYQHLSQKALEYTHHL
ncbi:MAG: glycosyltransferase, partial [bacterium]|nr:glycosyltransferase [bacterium]